MRGDKTPVSGGSRRRTRSQWDDYYYSEWKRKKKSPESGGTVSRTTNVVESDCVTGEGDGGERQDFVMVDEEEETSTDVSDKLNHLYRSEDESSTRADDDDEDEGDDFHDEDYEVDDQTSSDDSDASYNDEYYADGNVTSINGEKKKKATQRCGEEIPCSLRKTKRMSKKKEGDIQQTQEDAVIEVDVENGDDTHDHNGFCHIERHKNQRRPENVMITIDDEEKFPSNGERTGICGKKENDIEQERDGIKKSGLKRSHEEEKINPKKHLGSYTISMFQKKLCELGLCSYPFTRTESGEFSSSVDDQSKSSRDKDSCDIERVVDRGHCPFTKTENGEFGFPVDGQSKSSRGKDSCHIERVADRGKRLLQKVSKVSNKKIHAARNLDLIKIFVESMNSLKERQSPIEEAAMTQQALPLKFKFEDEVQRAPEKSEWEKEMESLFCELEMGLRGSDVDCINILAVENDKVISMEIDKSPAACCGRGEHLPVLDEQIGLICKHCSALILDIRWVMPPFYTPPPRRRGWMFFDESLDSAFGQIQFEDSTHGTPDSSSVAKGSVWDLIPGVEKQLYPHQREGFEFMWNNIAGSTNIEKLKQPLSDGGRGCIISHAPGTGKTRLSIVFLQSFLELYPTCYPVIIAPRGMLLTWEAEFKKWKVDIPFHNLNNMELSGNENGYALNVIGPVGGCGMSIKEIRLVKLYSWSRGKSVLGISYRLFERLAGDNVRRKEQDKEIRNILIESPGLLVLDEGHTPRNDLSIIWNVLQEVATQRRIILSGTPFQNNFTELYNTLRLVNPKFVDQVQTEKFCKIRGRKASVARKKWTNLTSTIPKNMDGLGKLRAMLDPFVHVYRGNILQETLPGLRDNLVFLHPSELQKKLLETASKERNIFHRIRLVSLVSVHPSLVKRFKRGGHEIMLEETECDLYAAGVKTKLEDTESDLDAGVKMKFIMKLIWLADALRERVLIFSQFIDPLEFIKKQIKSHFNWNEGKEVLHMDGSSDDKQRQDSISSFNDDSSDAKVLLASVRACSEGINLVGASRVVLLDTVWNPSVEKQAISRAFRIGQKKVVHVYRLFTSGTEVRQYAQQVHKKRISQMLFFPPDGQTCRSGKPPVMSKDDVLEAMVDLESFSHIFEKIFHQPTESDLLKIFGSVDDK